MSIVELIVFGIGIGVFGYYLFYSLPKKQRRKVKESQEEMKKIIRKIVKKSLEEAEK